MAVFIQNITGLEITNDALLNKLMQEYGSELKKNRLFVCK